MKQLYFTCNLPYLKFTTKGLPNHCCTFRNEYPCSIDQTLSTYVSCEIPMLLYFWNISYILKHRNLSNNMLLCIFSLIMLHSCYSSLKLTSYVKYVTLKIIRFIQQITPQTLALYTGNKNKNKKVEDTKKQNKTTIKPDLCTIRKMQMAFLTWKLRWQ